LIFPKGVIRSSFHSPDGKTFDEVALEDQKDCNGYNSRDERGGRNDTPVAYPLSLKSCESKGNGFFRIALDENQRPKVVVPYPSKFKNSQSRQSGGYKRHDYLSVNHEMPSTIYERRFKNAPWNRLHEVAQEEGTESKLEGDVEEDDPNIGIVNTDIHRKSVNGYQEHLERYQHAANKDKEDEFVESEVVPC